jgi:carbon-monoxide dehydrogenase medium subunit
MQWNQSGTNLEELLMYELEIYSPISLDEALQLKKTHGEEMQILAGGTDVLVHIQNNMDLLKKKKLLNISKIETLSYVNETQNDIEIGPLVTHSQLTQSQAIAQYVPALSKAAGFVGSPQIRNQGTIGGNIVNASPAADTLPVLYARDASVEVSTLNGEKLISIADFITGPGTVDIDPTGIVTKIIAPKMPDYTGDYQSLRQRKSMSINVVSLCVESLVSDDGVIEDIRIALGAVSPTVVRAEKTEKLLQGKKLTIKLIEKARRSVSGECVPINDIRSNQKYRSQMTGVLLEEYLQKLQ